MELKGDVIEMKYVVRLLGIEINNIKNVIHGEIEMPQNKKGSILGIYGANGSGKTVVVDCMVQITLKRNASSATAERLFHF